MWPLWSESEEYQAMRCGIDTVEISRIEKLLADHDRDGLLRFFSEDELDYANSGGNAAEKLAARFAAKEACAKLFPRETSLGHIEPVDFQVERGGHGQPLVKFSDRAEAVLNKYQVREISLSMTHTESTATAIAVTQPQPVRAPWYGRLAYHIAPVRRTVVLENLNRVFGASLDQSQIKGIAQGFYGHFIRFFIEGFLFRFKTLKQRRAMIRVEGEEYVLKALEQNKGVLLLSGHFGNWEVATIGGIGNHQTYSGQFHFIRRPLKPPFINRMVVKRFERNGFGVIEKLGTIDEILELLEENHMIVFPFDQFTIRRFGVPSEFFGHRAHTFKSLAVLAQFTGAPVIPSSSWREPDGTHVVHFDPPVEVVTTGRTRDIVSVNTKRFNQALERIILRHPEQWIWMHKRWKPV